MSICVVDFRKFNEHLFVPDAMDGHVRLTQCFIYFAISGCFSIEGRHFWELLGF